MPPWVQRTTPSPAAAAAASAWVVSGLAHAGEAEALAHARERKSDLFLTDDAAARVLAESLGLQVRGSLGVVLYAAATRMVERAEAESCLEALALRSTLWISPIVRRQAETALAQIFAP